MSFDYNSKNPTPRMSQKGLGGFNRGDLLMGGLGMLAGRNFQDGIANLANVAGRSMREREEKREKQQNQGALVRAMGLTDPKKQREAIASVAPEDRGLLYDFLRDQKNDARYNDELGYNRNRDAIGDQRWKQTQSWKREDRSNDVEHRERVFDRGVTESDRSFNRGVLESDRNFDLQNDQFDWRKDMDAASLILDQRKLEMDALAAKAQESGYSAGEIKAMREKGEQLSGFQNSLQTYLGEIKTKGIATWDIGGTSKKAARLDAMRQDLLFQGKNLWELGVLSKDDYENMERAIPDATGVGPAIGGKKVALEKAVPLTNSIEYQLDRLPEEYRSYKPAGPTGAGTVLQPQPAPVGSQVDGSQVPNLPDGTVVQGEDGKRYRVVGGQLQEMS